VNAQVLGIDRVGGFAEYTTIEASRVIPLPAFVSPAAGAALTCGGVMAHHALQTVARAVASETVLVWGTGGGGSLHGPDCAAPGSGCHHRRSSGSRTPARDCIGSRPDYTCRPSDGWPVRRHSGNRLGRCRARISRRSCDGEQPRGNAPAGGPLRGDVWTRERPNRPSPISALSSRASSTGIVRK
jgi:hypothetical protein